MSKSTPPPDEGSRDGHLDSFSATSSNTSATQSPDEGSRDGHLDNVEDGAGCVEIWERLSERRAAEE